MDDTVPTRSLHAVPEGSGIKAALRDVTVT
jgi:hypothetical protein